MSQSAFDFGPSETGPYGSEGPKPKDPRGRKPRQPKIVISRIRDGGRVEYVAEGLSEQVNERGLKVPPWTPKQALARAFASEESARGFAEKRIKGPYQIETV